MPPSPSDSAGGRENYRPLNHQLLVTVVGKGKKRPALPQPRPGQRQEGMGRGEDQEAPAQRHGTAPARGSRGD